MNIWLQIGIGLLPGAIAALIFMIRRRAYQFFKIILMALLIAGCSLCLFKGATTWLGTEVRETRREMSEKDMLSFANALLLEGAYPEATEVIDEYSATYGYDDDCRLLAARSALLQKDYAKAAGIYDDLAAHSDVISADDTEVTYAKQMSSGASSDLAMLDYLVSIGEDPADYGYTTTRTDLVNLLSGGEDDALKAMKKAIRARYKISEEDEDCAKAVAAVSESFAVETGDAFVSDDTATEDGTGLAGDTAADGTSYEKIYKRLEKKSTSYREFDCVTKALLKAAVLTGNYDAIPESLSDTSDYHSLMIAAELYMGHLVKASDFPDAFGTIRKADARLVLNQLDKVYNAASGDLNKTERKALKARIDSVDAQLEDPTLAVLKEKLTAAADNEAGSDRTKVYLELAKIENFYGNEAATDADLSTAIYSSQENTDDDYVAAMADIISVINNDDPEDTENIKNVTDYVNTVLDHSLTVDVEQIIAPAAEAAAAAEEAGESYENESDSGSGDGYYEEPDSSDEEEDEDSGNGASHSWDDFGGLSNNSATDDAYSVIDLNTTGTAAAVSTLNTTTGDADADQDLASATGLTTEGNVESGYSVATLSNTVADNNAAAASGSGSGAGQSTSVSKSFAQAATDFVSKARNAVSIGRIDASKFPEVTARLQIGVSGYNDENALKAALKVSDCDVDMNQFELRKLNFSGSEILLLCDVSGSMEGSIGDLQNAVTTFIDDRNSDEDLSVVTFSDSITNNVPFGSGDDALREAASAMTAYGGTDMFSAAVACLNDFPASAEKNNILILMTDGQDNSPRDASQIRDEIGSLAANKNITIYTIGLGTEVDTSYLSTIAGAGGGGFLYASDSSSLSTFYDMLHAQVSSQYELKYTAVDTMTQTGRPLTVSLPAANVKDTKNYSLPGVDPAAAGNNSNGTDPNALPPAQADLTIAGMSPRYLFQSRQKVTIKLKGNGFKKEDTVSVKLKGNIDYDLKATFADEETINLEVPASAAIDAYDVEVKINDKTKVLRKGFEILQQGSEKTTAFGPYVFTSSRKTQSGPDTYVLSGAVTMNGWLRFKGDVTLSGDLEHGGSIGVTEMDGSYVQFNDTEAGGIEGLLAKKGIPIDIPTFGSFTLYNDMTHIYDYDNYQADDLMTAGLTVYDLVHLETPTLRLYPNELRLRYQAGTTILPYQSRIITMAGGKTDDIFSFSVDGSSVITNEKLGMKLKSSYGDATKTKHKVSFLNAPVTFNGGLDVDIDTIENDYKIGLSVTFGFFEKAGFGAEVEWKGNLVPNAVQITVEPDPAPQFNVAGVPVSIDKFGVKVEDIDDAVQKSKFSTLKFTGIVSLSTGSIDDITKVKIMKKFFGKDISLLSLPDTTVSFRLSPFEITAEAHLKFLEEIEIANASLKIGTFDYTNALLHIDNEEVKGFQASVGAGIKWGESDAERHLNLSGNVDVDGTNRFAGLLFHGTAEYRFKIWMFDKHDSHNGDVSFGVYMPGDNNWELVFIVKYQNEKGKIDGKYYYVDNKGHVGNRNGQLTG